MISLRLSEQHAAKRSTLYTRVKKTLEGSFFFNPPDKSPPSIERLYDKRQYIHTHLLPRGVYIIIIIIIVCVSIFPFVPLRRWRAGDRTLDRTINTVLSCIWAARHFNNRSICIKNTNNNNKDKELIFSPGQKQLLCWILSTEWQVRQRPRKLIVGRWAAFFFVITLHS